MLKRLEHHRVTDICATLYIIFFLNNLLNAGNLQWSVGDGPKSMRPYEIFSLTSEVIVHLRGIEVGGVDQLAYQMLIPSAKLQNYIRLVRLEFNKSFNPPTIGHIFQ